MSLKSSIAVGDVHCGLFLLTANQNIVSLACESCKGRHLRVTILLLKQYTYLAPID